jgi:dTDP-glucose 4,6-dehydratase
MRNILVTGSAGFIGSNVIHFLLDKDSDVRILNVDCLTYAGNLSNLVEVEKYERYEFFKEDIRNTAAMESLIASRQINQVVHCAAESHVDRSIEDRASVMLEQLLLSCNKEMKKRYHRYDEIRVESPDSIGRG